MEPYTKRDGSIVYENSINERSLQLGRFQKGLYSKAYIRECYINNVNELLRVVPKLVQSGIKVFRMSSGVFSLAEFNRDILDNDEQISLLLAKLGNAFMTAGIRVTTHPDQFVVLSSDNPATVDNAIKELSHHAWVFDRMGLPVSPFAAINIHGGKSDRLGQLVKAIGYLPDNVRSRLTFENDESAYNIVDLLPVCEATGIPIVWDSHHHTFNDAGLSLDDAYGLALYTWRNTGCKPLQHLSNTTPGLEGGSFTERRKHSQYIEYIPDCQRDGLLRDMIDVDVEAKMKNLAVLGMKKLIKAS